MKNDRMPPRETTRKPPFSFLSGFLQGFAVADFNGDTFDAPRYHSGEGVRGDWKSAGRDLKSAVRKYDARRSA